MRVERNYDFSGGVQRRSSKFLRKENEVYKALNVDFDTLGAITKREGYSQKGDPIGTSDVVQDLFSFAKTDGNTYFLAVSNADVYKFNTGTSAWDAQSQSLTADQEADMATFVDYTFLVNGSDAPISYDGSSWSGSTNVTNAPTAYFAEAYAERLYMGRTDTYPSRVFFSGRPSSGTIAWDTSNDWIDVYPDDGSWIRGLESNGDTLFIFKDHSMHTWDLANLVTVSHTAGTLSNKSIASVGEWTLFLDERGIFASNGGRPKLLSEPVYDYIEGLTTTQLANAVAGAKGNCYYIYLGNTNGVSNCMLKLNIVQKTWTVYDLNDTIKAVARHEDASGNIDLYFGTNDGEIMKMFDTKEDDTTDISAEVVTRWHYPGRPEAYKNFREIQVHGGNLDNVTVKYQTDDDASWSTSMGTLSGDFSRLKFTGRGRGVRFKFEDSSDDDRFQLDGYSLLYKLDNIR